MQVLFKYYDRLDIDYFNKPTIKISGINKLNDPFEKIIEENLKKIALGHNQKSTTKNIFTEISFNFLIERIGVVSLTETPRNLLMWSHYANQHKGICVGYKTSYLDHHKHKTHNRLPVSFAPIKVNYDNCRYSEHTDSFTELNNVELQKEIILKSLITKGDDWIYEKEHRSIIPLEHNDHIYCTGNKNVRDYRKNVDLIEVVDEKEFKLKHQTLVDILEAARDDNLIFRLNIEPESITSIYFGCESDHFDNCRLVRKIRKNQRLSHIKIFQAMASRTKFELEIVPFIDDLNDYV